LKARRERIGRETKEEGREGGEAGRGGDRREGGREGGGGGGREEYHFVFIQTLKSKLSGQTDPAVLKSRGSFEWFRQLTMAVTQYTLCSILLAINKFVRTCLCGVD